MLSVVLCTHNPRVDYIHRCLALCETRHALPSDWEVLLVDNRSDELIDGRIDLSWHQQAKIIREERLGLTAARLCAAFESQRGIFWSS